MENIFNTINSLPILDTLDSFQIGYTKNGLGYCLLRKDGTKDDSFSVDINKNIITDFGKTGIKGGPFDFIGQYHLGYSYDDMRGTIARANTVKLFIGKGLVESSDFAKDFKKSLSSAELLEQYDELKLHGYKQEISYLLANRGVTYDFIKNNNLFLGELFKDISYYDNYFTTEFETHKDENGNWCNKTGDNPKQIGVFMFPCYDEKLNRIGVKLRRKDGKTIRGKKSYAIGKTGLLYDEIDSDTMIIVEGEMDYIIMKLMGYDNVIGNLGGVRSGITQLKELLYDTNKIICLYDDDSAGKAGVESLEKMLNRQLYIVDFPIKENVNGEKITDVNDLYKAGYNTKSKWDGILNKAHKKDSKGIIESEFIFLREDMDYYDTKFKKPRKVEKVSGFMGVTGKELYHMVRDKKIPTYTGLCYLDGGKKGYYNLLNKDGIMQYNPAIKPKIHSDIDKLINNLSNNIEANTEWLHRALLYKITHLNDVNLPAVIFYGHGGTGKGTYINLLAHIFGEVNILRNLKQRDLESSFDSYTGNKLIVEFQEIISGNTMQDKKTLDRIKSMVGEKRITVNQKFQQAQEVDNIAWFHFSSNHPVPIQLDNKDSGNRRFTIIKTGPKLDTEFAVNLNRKIISNKKIIEEYISRLFYTFPDVPELTTFEALENEDKKLLEDLTQTGAATFFDWFEIKFPYITKLSKKHLKMILEYYISDNGEDIYDSQWKMNIFEKNLPHKYKKKNINVEGKVILGFQIEKTEQMKDRIKNARLDGAKYVDYFKRGEVEQMDGITF